MEEEKEYLLEEIEEMEVPDKEEPSAYYKDCSKAIDTSVSVKENIELEPDWSKLKEKIGGEAYAELIKKSISAWMEYSGYKRHEELLVYEGILSTKRDKGLNSLLEED